MGKSNLIILSILLIGFVSCHEGGTDYVGETLSTEEYVSETLGDIQVENTDNANHPLNSTAATYQDEKRKFIRTADLSIEVENVYRSTTQIEAGVAALNGFVTQSNLESRILSNAIYPISSDTAKMVKKYQVSNRMTIRVPQKELGNFLISLGDQIQFLNYRNIAADDVSIDFIVQQMEKQRIDDTNQKLDNLSRQTGKIPDKKEVIVSMDEKEQEKNALTSGHLTMHDKVEFSTVDLLITEQPKVFESRIVNLETYDNKYRTGFWDNALNSLKGGLRLFENILLGLLYIWPVLILGGLLYLFIKKTKNRKAQIFKEIK